VTEAVLGRASVIVEPVNSPADGPRAARMGCGSDAKSWSYVYLYGRRNHSLTSRMKNVHTRDGVEENLSVVEIQ
jgi:hypothetical protein